jgi:hypothetical protein
MVRKSIAALLVLVVTAWAEVLLAPMFTIHVAHMNVAHMHAAREMAKPVATHHHVMPASHACCPGLHKNTPILPTLEFVAASLPCENQHRCCFRQGPQSAPAPVRERANNSQEVAKTDSAATQPTVRTEPWISVSFASALPPPTLFGMVSRI